MKITTKLNAEQMTMISNLIMNCENKIEMFDYLICKVNLKFKDAKSMSDSFKPIDVDSYTRLSFYYFEA